MKKAGYFLISAALAGTDLFLKDNMERRKIPGLIKNTGFAGSRLKKYPKIVMMVSAVFTFMIALYIAFGKESGKNSSIKKIGWSFVLGGALSNSADRIRKNYVVDYIPIGKFVYNISDFFIYIGALIAAAADFLEK
ncbi:MAG: signal peptidase II [Lachnospiraceae bacterium]|nr:signal peptidase II [Lachnospiraceae bacterium]